MFVDLLHPKRTSEQNEEAIDVSDAFHNPKNYPKVLIMVPNKELVLQVASMTHELLDALNNDVGNDAVTAETCTIQQDAWFYRDADAPDILICTPAIISKFIKGPHVEDEGVFRHVKHVVFDEADMLLEGSYLRDVEKVLDAFRLMRREQIRNGEIGINDKTVQFVLSAATLPTYGLKSMDSYVKKKFPSATRITNDHLHMHHPQIIQDFVQLNDEMADGMRRSHTEEPPITCPDRMEAITAAIRSLNPESGATSDMHIPGGSTMIFVNTAEAAIELAEALRNPISGSPLECAEFHKLLPGKQKQEQLETLASCPRSKWSANSTCVPEIQAQH